MTRTRWALVVLVPVALALVLYSGLGRQLWYGRKGAVAHERQRRITTVADLAPVPVPTALPLVGPEGRNHEGEPNAYVDRPAFRSLLFHGDHAALTRYLERLQAAFEADPACEYWPIDAGDAFVSAEPELLPRLDAWAAATPDSFAPYLARAAYFSAVAQARRGAKWALETPFEDFAAMRDAVRRGIADAERALAIRPKLVAAQRLVIKLSGLDEDGGRRRAALDQALAACPTCFQVRVTYIFAILPRWGGSHAAMKAFARASTHPARPRLRHLAGYADLDVAWLRRRDGNLVAAREAVARSLAFGEQWEFLQELAAIELADHKPARAIEALDRAAAARPGHPDVLADRARARGAAERWEEAGDDLLAALRAEPTHSDARRYHPTIVRGLAREAWAQHLAGYPENARRIIGLAVELAVDDVEVLRHKTAIEGGKTELRAGNEIEVLEQAIREHPDSFRVHRALDHALAREKRFERVVRVWTAYLARHPDDGAAHLERGGAHYHMNKPAEARADAARACTLGFAEGCEREKQLGRR
jgi:tetratricopeptide (TPR) repeat protein